MFSQFSNFIYLQQGSTEAESDSSDERIIGHLSCKSKFTLHISEDGLPDFDRLSIVNTTFAGGSVLVSDTQFLDKNCLAGVHYFHDDVKHIPQLLEWLIKDSEGQKQAETVRHAAFEVIRDTNNNVTRPKRLLHFLCDAEIEHAES